MCGENNNIRVGSRMICLMDIYICARYHVLAWGGGILYRTVNNSSTNNVNGSGEFKNPPCGWGGGWKSEVT